jgi:2-polyprenyl-3-methyl-5-hydroxy-6-metoxy-1,4-benzoquinol methylase
VPPAPAFDAWSLREAAEALLLVTAARESGILEEIVEIERTPAEVAAARGLDARAVRVCLSALEAIGVVETAARRPGAYRLSDFGRSRFLDPESRRYVAGELALWREGLRGWLFLEDVLRSGKPLPEADDPLVRASLWRALDVKPKERVTAVVDVTLARVERGRRARSPAVLDVGGGSGVFARAFVERGCRVTLLDTHETLRFARGAFGLDGVEQLTLVEGDFTAGLPPGPYDVILLADVLHGLAPQEARGLLRTVGSRLAPRGVAALVDLFRGRSARAALYAVTLLLYGEGADTHEADGVVRWLEEAGCGAARFRDLDAGRALLTAVRSPARRRGSG